MKELRKNRRTRGLHRANMERGIYVSFPGRKFPMPYNLQVENTGKFGKIPANTGGWPVIVRILQNVAVCLFQKQGIPVQTAMLWVALPVFTVEENIK